MITANPLSQPTMPTLSRAFEQPDDAARYAHQAIGNQRDREYGGFILRRDDGRYVATNPIRGTSFQFDPNSVFTLVDAEGNVLYPAGHRDYALYHSHPVISFDTHAGATASFSKPQGWSNDEIAAYVNFFSATDMYGAIAQRDLASVVYLSAPDGGLIRYTSSDSLAERALLQRLSGPAHDPHAADLSELYESIVSGALKPSDFIRLVAAAGDLQVVVASRLWGKVGRVATDWQPYPRRNDFAVCESVYPPLSPLLSPVFGSADEVGKYVHGRLAGQSREAIVGVLLKNPATGDYRAVEPLVNGEAVDSRCSLLHPDAYYRPALPAGYRIDGLYFAGANPPDEFSGEAQELSRHFFQPADLHRLFEYRHVPTNTPPGRPVRYGFTLSEVYFCAADGALLGYAPSHSPAEYALARQLSRAYSGSESIQNQIDSGRMSIRDFIRLVAGAGRLRVLTVSDNWPQAGQV